MPRKLRDSSTDTRTAREKLKPNKKPYYRLVVTGCHIGYYKGSKDGSWIARRLNSNTGKYEEHKLGVADDKSDADGIHVLSFSQALEAADKWFKQKIREEVGHTAVGSYTVQHALIDYVQNYTNRGGKALKELNYQIDSIILPSLSNLKIEQLTTKRLREWHNKLAETPPRLRTKKGEKPRFQEGCYNFDYTRKRRSTANRTLTVLKAALNHAYQEGRIASDDAWRRVKPFRGVDLPKVSYLSLEDARRLVNATDPSFRPLVQAALLSGCRYGEIIALKASDFDARSAILHIRMSKSGKPRHIALNDEGVALFSHVTLGLIKDQLIFTKQDGKPWGKSHQQRPLQKACEISKIPGIVTFHILRHTYASHLVQSGVPLPVIAANLGHSDSRISEKHYAHLAPSYVADVIQKSMPKFGITEQSNITHLHISERIMQIT